MDIVKMKRKDFDNMPHHKCGEDIGEFDCLIILPLRRRHESGYRCMDFVAVRGNEPICLLSGCSDVIEIDGIGGYGIDWLEKYSCCPGLVPTAGWMIDCLPVSGLLRMFCRRRKLKAAPAVSSFEIYQVPAEARNAKG